MRKIIIILSLISSFTTLSTKSMIVERNICIEEVEKSIPNDLNVFLDRIAFKESRGNWKIVNRYGYVGKYQFGIAARKTIKIKHFTWQQFEANPSIWPEHEQDSAMIKLMKFKHKMISKVLTPAHFELTYKVNSDTKWYSKNDCVKLTWSGIYAACHLVGTGNVKKFIDTNGKFNKKDGNGVTTFDYLKEFSDIDMQPIS